MTVSVHCNIFSWLGIWDTQRRHLTTLSKLPYQYCRSGVRVYVCICLCVCVCVHVCVCVCVVSHCIVEIKIAETEKPELIDEFLEYWL